MTDLEILEGAHALISRPGGWTQGVDYEVNGTQAAYCLRGAILAYADRAAWERIRPRLTAVIVTFAPMINRLWAVTSYNDAQGRRKEDVLRVLEIAIADERARLQEIATLSCTHGIDNGFICLECGEPVKEEKPLKENVLVTVS